MAGRKVYALDTRAFLSVQLEPGPAELITVQEVVDEVLYGGLAPERLATALARQVVKLKKPSQSSVERVKVAAASTGDLPRLSKADVNLLAAAFDAFSEGASVVVLSDDYSLQNTALKLGLEVAGLARQPVKELREWISKCVVCGKVYGRAVGDVCPSCGGEVVRYVRASEGR
ncbi:MAG: NOB1 family endonuclease [Candidatus Caldarchaeum sp.]|nr:NOB1 family endonuclease [Candidatus Caldarchaeum sp.]MCS7138067.1 NOB1 family endonuclease [Candidatus Caldarchaeum sp.]MDW7977702.1 NOB1 family endonuclease [Candidatus Caldarchaeum sp.]MDW8359799.1 NOB1 family endonuclease [Candidatus Caldarchaeum sp.]